MLEMSVTFPRLFVVEFFGRSVLLHIAGIVESIGLSTRYVTMGSISPSFCFGDDIDELKEMSVGEHIKRWNICYIMN